MITCGTFLIIYTIALTGNLLVITVIATSHHIHTPMYFFLMNLSIIDLGSISNILPKAMANALLNTRRIPYTGCAIQVFFLFFFIVSEIFLLTIMAYDRFIAICDPLHYGTVMNKRVCFQLTGGAWFLGFLYGIVHTCSTFIIPFCSNVISQFFCDVPQLLKLSCSNLYLIEVGIVVACFCVTAGCFVFIIISYVHIFRTVQRMTSMEGRRKTFSTCIPHLMVVCLFIFSGAFAYLKPVSRSTSNWDLTVSLMYSVIQPTMNPIIYTIRNKEIKAELYKLFYWKLLFKRAIR